MRDGHGVGRDEHGECGYDSHEAEGERRAGNEHVGQDVIVTEKSKQE